jgi:hypothetical protein
MNLFSRLLGQKRALAKRMEAGEAVPELLTVSFLAAGVRRKPIAVPHAPPRGDP